MFPALHSTGGTSSTSYKEHTSPYKGSMLQMIIKSRSSSFPDLAIALEWREVARRDLFRLRSCGY